MEDNLSSIFIFICKVLIIKIIINFSFLFTKVKLAFF
nr:MAG TPA: hypothetical protein [Caudoviricetes sp.]